MCPIDSKEYFAGILEWPWMSWPQTATRETKMSGVSRRQGQSGIVLLETLPALLILAAMPRDA